MILCDMTPATMTTGVAVGLTETYNTNNNLELVADAIQIKQPGFYEIIGEATVTSGAAGNYGVMVNINDEPYGTESYAKAAEASEIVTIPIYAVANVVSADAEDFVEVTFTPVGTSPVLVQGTISIKRLS